jgi:hypothetical protein
VFAFGAFDTCSPIVGLPLVRVMVSAGTETIWTVPSWPTVAGEVRTAVVPDDDAEPAVAPEDAPEPAVAPDGEPEPVVAPDDGREPAGVTVRFEIWSRLVSDPRPAAEWSPSPA